uniref:hypothetical protein n=1 Tax=Pseudomonas indica TaxID=137658 RepID=UPI003FD16E34
RQDLNHRPVSPAHSTRIRRRHNPSLLLNPLIIKEFFIQAAPEVARIIEPFEQPSIPISMCAQLLYFAIRNRAFIGLT